MLKYMKDILSTFYHAYTGELKVVLRDAGVLLILFGASLFYPLIYSLAYSNEVISNIDVAVVDLSGTQSSRNLTKMIDASFQVNVAYHADDYKRAQNLFYDNKVHGIIVIPKDFERKVFRGEQASVEAYVDASYFMLYKQVLTAATNAVGTMGVKVEVARLMQKGVDMETAMAQSQPISVAPKYLFNPSSGYASYAMPAILILILQQTLLLSIGMLGGTLQEKKRKYFFVDPSIKPSHVPAVMFGKASAFITLQLINMVYMFIFVYRWFGLPHKGCNLEMLLFVLPYLFGVCFLGFAISSMIKKRENSLIFMFFTSIPFVFLSGFSWPSAEMPGILQLIAYVIPSTPAIMGFLRLNTMCAPIGFVSGEYIHLCILMVVYFLLAWWIIRRHIEKNKEPELEAEH